jgi:endonuclease YncB( thermonuclease family)
MPGLIFALGFAAGGALAHLAGSTPELRRAIDPVVTGSLQSSDDGMTYRAEVLRVIDGDTLEARVHVWLGQEIVTKVRLAGIDAPELHARCAAERAGAEAARSALAALVEGRSVRLTDVRPDKYFGRVVARISAGGHDAGAALLAAGHARLYGGGRRGGWCG